MIERDDIIDTLKNGGVGILPTDTLYGLVGSALLPEAVERIYELKQRDPNKALIVLIADVEDVEQFGVVLSEELTGAARGESSGGLLGHYWPADVASDGAGKPGSYSIILPTIDEEFSYLHREGGTIAFRLPDKEDLRELIREVGPLVAPSANVEGKPPARTVEEAQKYFGSDVDFYVDGGELAGRPSTIIEFDGEGIRIIR